MSSNLGFWLCDRNHISIDQYPGLIGMVQGNADPGFWSCDRNHMIGELAGPDQVHQSNIPVSHPVAWLDTQRDADPGFWSCDRSHMIGELAGPDQVHQSNIPVSHPILRLSQLAPKRSGRTVPFLLCITRVVALFCHKLILKCTY